MQQSPKGAMTSQHESDAIKRSERNTMDSQAWWGRNGISHLTNGDDHGVLGMTTMSLSPPNHHHLHGDSSSLAKQSSKILQSVADGICGEEEGIQSNPPMELLSHTVACGSFPYSDPYYGGLLPPNYGPHSMCVGLSSARMALPLEVAEEPVYVNAKQYHGILRRRQIRAKAELEKKLVKVRKPYLHKSRHLHAMRRARGSGGRFLNTKEAVEKKPANDSTANPSRSSPSSSDHHDEMSSQNEAFSNVNGSSYYARNHEFQLSAYHTLSSGNYGKTDNEGDFSGQHRDRIMVRGAHRALSIK